MKKQTWKVMGVKTKVNVTEGAGWHHPSALGNICVRAALKLQALTNVRLVVRSI